jgi:glyoxylase-like metal-dependent hydrolase (beta-lactamase superfamily II)
VNLAWERLADGVFRCRLEFLDVTVGLVHGRAGVLLIDTGTTLAEARAVAADVRTMSGREVSHIVLTHNHFDHILGSAAFTDAAVYCAPEVAATMAGRTDHLRADALRHGADADAVGVAIAALRAPEHQLRSAVIELGDRSVSISHPGRGHTDHDLIAVVPGTDRAVVFCGDLVEESGDPCADADSDPAAWPATLDRVLAAGGEDAVFVPGHGAVVGADFIRGQRDWLRGRL